MNRTWSLAAWLFTGLIAIAFGCRDQTNNPHVSTKGDSVLSDTKLNDTERGKSNAKVEKGASGRLELPVSPPQWTLVFSELTGPLVDWGQAPEKELYAKKSILNTPAPELVVQNWLGDTPETTGKFVLVDFWATWCSPCRDAIPHLNQIAEKFSEELVVLGLSDQTEEEVRAMREPVMNYYSAIDPAGRTKLAIGVRGIPHVVLIDPSGIVCWQGFPSDKQYPLTADTIQGCIDRYRAEQP